MNSRSTLRPPEGALAFKMCRSDGAGSFSAKTDAKREKRGERIVTCGNKRVSH
jgi:hypothetical protein